MLFRSMSLCGLNHSFTTTSPCAPFSSLFTVSKNVYSTVQYNTLFFKVDYHYCNLTFRLHAIILHPLALAPLTWCWLVMMRLAPLFVLLGPSITRSPLCCKSDFFFFFFFSTRLASFQRRLASGQCVNGSSFKHC